MKILVHIRWFLIVIPLGVFSLTAFFMYPFAYMMRGFKFNPLWIYLDDTKYKNGEFAEDYKEFLDGKKDNFINSYRWAGVRNRIWNLINLIRPKKGNEVIVSSKGQLYRNDKEVSILEFAAWKWLINGVGGWNTNSGDEINLEKSTIGESSVYYKIDNILYYRYSRAWKFRRYYLNVKIGTNNKRYLLTFKIQ